MNKVFRRIAAAAAIGLLSGVAVSAGAGAITPGTGCGTATGQAFFASSNSTLCDGTELSQPGRNRCKTAGGAVQAQGFGSWRTLSQTSTRNCPTGQSIYNWGWQVGS